MVTCSREISDATGGSSYGAALASDRAAVADQRRQVRRADIAAADESRGETAGQTGREKSRASTGTGEGRGSRTSAVRSAVAALGRADARLHRAEHRPGQLLA